MNSNEIRCYEALDGWRWRAVVPGNGRIVADSAEAYDTESNAYRAANDFAATPLTVVART